MQFKIIYEDADVLVCFKPAGIATQTASLASQDMVSLLKNYLVKQGSGKDPYLGLIHRLDQPVSGLLVFAKTKKAAASLSRQIQDGCANKDYLALCHGLLFQREGTLVHMLTKDPVTKLAKVVKQDSEKRVREDCSHNKGNYANRNKDIKTDLKEAILHYEVEEERENSSLVKVHLHTGRFHQIRAQFSAIGHPLLGDSKYSSVESKELSTTLRINKIALCAYRLMFKHPVTEKEMEFELDKEDLPSWCKSHKNVEEE